jgi:fused signal recognition particle receptor
MNDSANQDSATKSSWWRRLTTGLRRTSASIGSAISDLVSKRKLDAGTIEELEELLIRADLGVATAAKVAAAVGMGRYDTTVTADEVKRILAAEVEKILAPVARPLVVDPAARPFVILVVGVNGSGKTTTIGKLAARFHGEGRKVMLRRATLSGPPRSSSSRSGDSAPAAPWWRAARARTPPRSPSRPWRRRARRRSTC